ncbi:DUF3800 domain-containing protein [Demequina sp.]|uniref:DUF3800 domain-containing protein n=1 Tax=Demequina sp. TaxID=2050685 RepID=UPI003D0B270B
MLLAYVDESGNTGAPAAGGSLTYALGCVLVDADRWPGAFDELLAFRRRLRDDFGLPMRSEIKAQYLTRGSGDLRALGLAPAQRGLIYRAHLDMLSTLPARAFAVVVDKRDRDLTPSGCFDLAWEGLMQRLERTSHYENATFMLIHDDGDNDAVRRWTRRARRHLTAGLMNGGGSVRNPARLLVDDPVARHSHQSYLIQIADLVAYAGFRSVVPPGGSVAQVCPSTTWEALGPATHTAVNKHAQRAAPGIVLR